jgi:hypothetical protein
LLKDVFISIVSIGNDTLLAGLLLHEKVIKMKKAIRGKVLFKVSNVDKKFMKMLKYILLLVILVEYAFRMLFKVFFVVK